MTSEELYKKRGSSDRSTRSSAHEQVTRDWRAQARPGGKLWKEGDSPFEIRTFSKKDAERRRNHDKQVQAARQAGGTGGV
eukprot:218316-Heterocapsa_arctica.AAC.1